MAIVDPFEDSPMAPSGSIVDPFEDINPSAATTPVATPPVQVVSSGEVSALDVAAKVGKTTVNTATDLLDMVLGWIPAAANVLETMAASAGVAVAQAELGEPRSFGRAIKGGTAYVAQEYEKSPYVTGSLSPIRSLRTAVGVPTEELVSPISKVSEKIGEKIQKFGQSREEATGKEGTKELIDLVSNALMVSLPDIVSGAKQGYHKALAKYHATTKVQSTVAQGFDAPTAADAILKKAAEQGIDTSAITKEAVVSEITKRTGLPEIERRAIQVDVPVERRSSTWSPMKHNEYKAAADVLKAANYMLAQSDPATVGHEGRVAGSTVILAKKLGLNKEQVARAELAASGHDLGKIGMKDLINKQGVLSANDLATLQAHPAYTADLMRQLGIPENIIKVASEHHTGATPEFTSQLVRIADIGDSLIGGPNSGHSYPLRFHDGLKTHILPRTLENVLKVMDDMVEHKQINPEIYVTYREMLTKGNLPHVQKVQLEAAGEVPWKQPIKIRPITEPDGWKSIMGGTVPFTKEEVMAALPSGMAKAAQQMLQKADRYERGGLVIDTFENTKNEMAKRISKLSGRSYEAERLLVERSLPADRTKSVYAYYNEGTGTIYYATDRVAKPKLIASTIAHEVAHMANNDKLNLEIVKRISRVGDEEQLPFFDPKAKPSEDFYSRVRARLVYAGATRTPEEFTSYFIEEAMRMGSQAGFSRLDTGFWKWATSALPTDAVTHLKQWVANVRAALYKYGATISESDLTVDDIIALNKANMKALAEGRMAAAGEAYVSAAPRGLPEPEELSGVEKGIFKRERTEADLKEGEVPTLVGSHFSGAEREILLGGKYSTGIKGAEAKRLAATEDSRLKSRISFYVDEGTGVYPEAGVGAVRHEVPLTNLYDAAVNPLKLPVADLNKFESAVLDKGFSGYYVKSGFGKQGTAVLLGEAAKEIKVPTIEPKLSDFTPEKIKDVLNKENWAILTAENPKGTPLTPEENAYRMVELKRLLDSHGIKYTEVEGQYGGMKEHSLLLRGVSQSEALGFAGAFSQESVLTGEGLLYTDGRMNKATGVTKHTTPPQDNYTKIPETGAIFSVDIDFDRFYPIQEMKGTLPGHTIGMPNPEARFGRTITIRKGTMTEATGGLASELLPPSEKYFDALDKSSAQVQYKDRYPTASMSTELLATIRDVDRRSSPKDTVTSPGGIEEVKQSIRDRGYDIKKPVTVTISTADHMAYISDGNTRVSAALELGLKEVPVRFEKTEVPFTSTQRAKARLLSELGLREEQIPDRIRTPQEIADRDELRRLLNEKPDYFKKEAGKVDQKLLIASGLVLGGATLGAYLSPADTTEGLVAGAAFGFALTTLPKAANAISKNFKEGLKIAAIGVAYAGIGAAVDKENPIEGILVGSVLFGLRFLPKSKIHSEDDLINARNGNIAAEKRLIAQISDAMKKAIPDTAKREQLAVLAENPKFTGRTPQERSVVAAWRGLSKSYRDAAVNENVKIGFVEGYVSHIIDREGLPQTEVKRILTELFGMPRTAAGGRARFTKARQFATFEELETALKGTSLKLKTKDIAEITKIYGETMIRTIENQRLINNLRAATLGDELGRNARLITTEMQPGYVRASHPQLLPYYIHPDVAPALKFVFDSRNHTDLVNGLLTLNRATKRMNVMGSFFHAKSLLEAYALAGGELFKARGAIEAALKQFKNGGLGDEIDLLMRDGLRVEMPTEISSQALAQVGQLADYYTSKLIGKPIYAGEKVLGKVETLQENVFDKFTWDYLHTGLKLATALRLMEDYKLGTKGKGMDVSTYRQGVASHINDTFGGLDWYRVVTEAKTEAGRKIAMGALKPSSRDILGVAIFAPDWTISTIRAVSKALPRGAKNPINAQLARQYALRTAVLYATVITPINYILSGHFPWDNKDPTRIDLGDGTNLQVVKHSMEFAEWVREPFKTFSNKMGFIPRTFEALRTGKQYPKGPDVENKLGFVTAQVAPFTARSFQGDIDPQTSAARALLGMFGISVYGMTEAEKEQAREARRLRKEKRGQIVDPFKAGE